MDESKDRHPSLGKSLNERLNMTRRSFVKLAAATAAVATMASGTTTVALAADNGASSSLGEVKRIRSCCRACGKIECGVWVTVQDGKVIKTEGDEQCFGTAGNHCAKGQASLQAAYHPARLMYPMRRTGPKNEPPNWERMSYDEAFTLSATSFTNLQEKYGNECLITSGSTSRIFAMQGYGMGTPLGTSTNHTAAQICKGPRYACCTLNTGNQSMFWMELVSRPRVYVQWGSATELSNYDDSCRTTVDVATRADTYMIVDPRQTNLGRQADIWLNLESGTDGLMANAWMHTIIQNELYDDFYVRKWTNAPMLIVEEESFKPTACETISSTLNPPKNTTRLLKESDIKEGGISGRFMVLNELSGELSWYDARVPAAATSPSYIPGFTPGWEGEDWKPATKGFTPKIRGIDLTGASPGFVLDYVPFPEGLLPALHTQPGGLEVELKDGTKVHVRTVWERYIEFLEDYTPEKVAGPTTVSADRIKAAAIKYATRVDPSTGYGNGAIHYTLASEQTTNCVQNNRGFDLLGIVCGNCDIPGGARGSTTGPMSEMIGNPTANATNSPDWPWPTVDRTKNLTQLIPFLAYGTPLNTSDATSIFHAIETGTPYQPHCWLAAVGNAVLNQSNNIYAYEQLCKLDYVLLHDVWRTPFVEGAGDVVMPASHWLEISAPRKSQGSGGHIGATVKAIDPPGEAMSDYVLCQGLLKARGVPYYPGTTDAERWPFINGNEAAITAACNASIQFPTTTAMPMPTVWADYNAEFQKNGWWDSKLVYPSNWGTYRRYQNGNQPGAIGRQGFPNPTGKQEIWSVRVEAWDVASNDMFPRFVAPPHGRIAEPERFATDNDFNLTTGRRQGTYFHSEHRQLPFCREIAPAPRLEINPVAAAKIGIEQGDWVWVETNYNNKVNKVRLVADLYYGIAPGTVNAEHSWWYPELDQPDRGFKLSAINCLVDQFAQDRMYGSSYLRGYHVKVYKATPENSPFGNPVPCGNDGTPIIHDASDPRLKDWAPVYEGRM